MQMRLFLPAYLLNSRYLSYRVQVNIFFNIQKLEKFRFQIQINPPKVKFDLFEKIILPSF